MVHVKGSDGSLRQIAVAHRDPDKAAPGRELHDRYPPDPERQSGVPKVIRTGEAEVYEQIPESLFEETAQDEDHLRILRRWACARR